MCLGTNSSSKVSLGNFQCQLNQCYGLRSLFIVRQLGQCHPSISAPLVLAKLKPKRLNPAQQTELPKLNTHSFSVSNCCYIWKTLSREDRALQGRERKQTPCLHSAGQHCSPKLPWLDKTQVLLLKKLTLKALVTHTSPAPPRPVNIPLKASRHHRVTQRMYQLRPSSSDEIAPTARQAQPRSSGKAIQQKARTHPKRSGMAQNQPCASLRHQQRQENVTAMRRGCRVSAAFLGPSRWQTRHQPNRTGLAGPRSQWLKRALPAVSSPSEPNKARTRFSGCLSPPLPFCQRHKSQQRSC